jgi:hypothetical protein
MNKLFSAAVIFPLIIFQQVLKKAPVNPSGPGALSDGQLASSDLISIDQTGGLDLASLSKDH